ncbi:MAG: alpha/beta hydrolase [Hymenobacter sp.]
MVALAPNGLLGSDIAMQQREMTLRSLQMPSGELAAALKRYQLIINTIQQTITQSQGRAIVAKMLKQDNPVLDEATVQTRAAELTTVPYRAFLSFSPAESLPKVVCPVLLLYGTADQVLDPDANLAVLTKGLKGNKGVTARKLPGVNHLFQPDHDQWPIVAGESQAVFSPAAQDAVRAWIVAQTGGPAAPGGPAQAQH